MAVQVLLRIACGDFHSLPLSVTLLLTKVILALCGKGVVYGCAHACVSQCISEHQPAVCWSSRCAGSSSTCFLLLVLLSLGTGAIYRTLPATSDVLLLLLLLRCVWLPLQSARLRIGQWQMKRPEHKRKAAASECVQ
jgi:hypothetical protein